MQTEKNVFFKSLGLGLINRREIKFLKVGVIDTGAHKYSITQMCLCMFCTSINEFICALCNV